MTSCASVARCRRRDSSASTLGGKMKIFNESLGQRPDSDALVPAGRGMTTAQPRQVAWNALLRPLGVTIRSDMAYDLLANEVIPLPTDFGRVLQVYPFFIRAQSTRATPVNKDLGAVVLTWASTIDTTGAAKGAVTPLLTSSRATGTFTNVTTIAPTQDFPQSELRPRLLAVMVAPPPAKDGSKPRGRVAVATMGDDDPTDARRLSLQRVERALELWTGAEHRDDHVQWKRCSDHRPGIRSSTSTG